MVSECSPRCATLCVTVVDGHEAVRAAVRWWCSQERPAIQVAATYSSLDEMLRNRSDRPCDRSVVVLELESPSGQLRYVDLQRLTEAGRRVVIYSHLTAYEMVLSALEIGAVSYVAKAEDHEHLMRAIHTAESVQPYSGPLMTTAVGSAAVRNRPRLGFREREILIAWFQTESKDLVGTQFQISTSTVRTHLERIRAKYAAVGRPAPTKAALVARAIQDGVIGIDDL
jgi:DNA-binding NarL/FixJ family response regulator